MNHFQYDFLLCAPPNGKDIETAERLAVSIQKYKLPRGAFSTVQGAGYTRICSFCGDVWDDALRQNLDDSRFLVVVCTPRTHGSAVIARMLEYFAGLGRKANIIAVLAEGEPVEAFPPFFIEEKEVPHMLPDGSIEMQTETIEPVASDLRAQSPGEARRRLAYETVRIVAALVGIHPDVLERRHEKRRKRRMVTLLATVGTLALVVAAVFGYFGVKARQEGAIATRQAQLGAEMATRIFTQLPGHFAHLPDAAAIVDSALLGSLDTLLAGEGAGLELIDLGTVLAVANTDSDATVVHKGALWRRAGNPQNALALYEQGFTAAGLDDSLLSPFLADMEALTATGQNPAGYLYYLFRDDADSSLQAGDMLIALNGQSFDTAQRYQTLLNNALPDAVLQVRILRRDNTGGFTVYTEEVPRDALAALPVMGV
ncbi:MAG: hypothetical protein GXY32_03610 [Ruminococcaceae bacterium]|nr:hypothetical protein [Oscillospiraceae bacterium]